jgi:predicted hydrocarbon binding protein
MNTTQFADKFNSQPGMAANAPFLERPAPHRSWSLSLDSSEMKQHFEFRNQQGVILNRLSNQRVFVVGSDSWADMENGLNQTFGTGSKVIMEKLGLYYGTSAARKIKGLVGTISELRRLAARAGFGTFRIRADEETGSWIRVDALECVFCEGQGSDHDCAFLSGMIQGMAEEFYSKNYTIIRRKCHVLNGRHTCEIVLQEAYYDPIQKRRPILSRLDNPLGEEFR